MELLLFFQLAEENYLFTWQFSQMVDVYFSMLFSMEEPRIQVKTKMIKAN